MQVSNRVRSHVIAVLLAAGLASASVPPAFAAEQHRFDVPATEARAAIREFAAQAKVQILVDGDNVENARLNPVAGNLSTEEGLRVLLAQSGLKARYVGERSIALVKEGEDVTRAETAGKMRVAQAEGGVTSESSPESEPAGKGEEIEAKGIPEVLVKGSRSLNVDIERTRDDTQPYVVFDHESIERSGATSVDDFLRTRLPMNAARAPTKQADMYMGNLSNVNLRGLGQNQTLILIDGRRAASTSTGDQAGQADINGIPLEAIERIEVLPSTASAIYGGSATGGVVNIVMRRDYVGTQAAMTYDNGFDGDSAIKRIDLSTAFTLSEGKTSVSLTGSYTESNPLRNSERDFVLRGRKAILARNPDLIYIFQGAGTNIRSSSGEDLTLDDGTPLNASFTSVPTTYGGFSSDGGAALLGNAGTYNLGLAGSNSSVQGANGVIAGGGPAATYVSGSLRHEFSDRIKGFLEISQSVNDSVANSGRGVSLPGSIPADAPSNPFQQDIYIAWTTKQLGGEVESKSGYERYGAGFVFQLPKDWVSSVDYTLSRSRYSVEHTYPSFPSPATDFYAAVADGSIDVLRDFDSQGIDPSGYIGSPYTFLQEPIRVTTRNPALRLSGPIGSLPAGRPQLSLLLEQQDSKFGGSTQQIVSQYQLLFPERKRSIDSAYLELRVPLLSQRSNVAWADELELQVAGRYDRYQSTNGTFIYCETSQCSSQSFDFTHSTTEEFSPLVALRFKPGKSLALRASYGTGFLPPDISQLTASFVDSPVIGGNGLTDPRRGNSAVGTYTPTYGGNPNLKSETSRTWSAGFILTPSQIEGLRLSVDYTRIKKKGNIVSLSEQQILENEEYFPGRVTRGAALPGDPAGWAGPVTAIDSTDINAAGTRLQAYDVQFDYALPSTRWGTFSVFAMGTWETQLDVQTTPTAPVTDYLGWASVNNTPLDFKGNLGVEWSRQQWTLGWTTRYFSSYYVADPNSEASAGRFLAQGNGGRVPDQMYHDLSARYQFETSPAGSGGSLSNLLHGLQVRAGVRNVFNKKPPLDLSQYSNYYFSGFGDPRLTTYYLSIRKSFD